MTVACAPRKAPPERPERPPFSWCCVGILLLALVFPLPLFAFGRRLERVCSRQRTGVGGKQAGQNRWGELAWRLGAEARSGIHPGLGEFGVEGVTSVSQAVLFRDPMGWGPHSDQGQGMRGGGH